MIQPRQSLIHEGVRLPLRPCFDVGFPIIEIRAVWLRPCGSTLYVSVLHLPHKLVRSPLRIFTGDAFRVFLCRQLVDPVLNRIISPPRALFALPKRPLILLLISLRDRFVWTARVSSGFTTLYLLGGFGRITRRCFTTRDDVRVYY